MAMESESESSSPPVAAGEGQSMEKRNNGSSSTSIPSMELVADAKSNYTAYEDKFFNTIQQELKSTREYPAATVGVGLAAALFLLPVGMENSYPFFFFILVPFCYWLKCFCCQRLAGPRRFLFRHTLGRLRSEEAKFVKAEKNVKELSLSVDVMKNESRKLLERAALAEKDMKYGHTELTNAGNHIQRLAKSVYKVETQAADLMDGLRETPGREALRLRAEASRALS
ncbi:hypothetical protein F8388_003531, partial [Cannabis sativa]